MMTEQTIVAVYDELSDADAVVRELEAASVPPQAISRLEGSTDMTSAPEHDEGYWVRLFGGEPDHDTSVYDRSIESGSTVVAVRVSSEHVDRVSAILETHHPVDIDERLAEYRASETTTAPAASPKTAPAMTAEASESGTIQLSEEALEVGKRMVTGETTRIHRFAVETPVREEVSLRDETVTLERHPVTDGRPVGNVDFTDQVVEMTETHEQAVVSKSAYVVEEVNLRKDVSDHVETVNDTTRRDEIEVEKVPAESRAARVTTVTPPQADKSK